MRSDDPPSVFIRPMTPADRAAVADIVVSAGNFSQTEIEGALERADIYLTDERQADYRVAVVVDRASNVQAYACWGPVPLTRGAFDLYWIASHPGSRGRGYGRALMACVEGKVRELKLRLLAVETSSQLSYTSTVEFYRRLGYGEFCRIGNFYDVGDDKLTLVKRLS